MNTLSFLYSSHGQGLSHEHIILPIQFSRARTVPWTHYPSYTVLTGKDCPMNTLSFLYSSHGQGLSHEYIILPTVLTGKDCPMNSAHVYSLFICVQLFNAMRLFNGTSMIVYHVQGILARKLLLHYIPIHVWRFKHFTDTVDVPISITKTTLVE
jgi:hypothetical protein